MGEQPSGSQAGGLPGGGSCGKGAWVQPFLKSFPLSVRSVHYPLAGMRWEKTWSDFVSGVRLEGRGIRCPAVTAGDGGC